MDMLDDFPLPVIHGEVADGRDTSDVFKASARGVTLADVLGSVEDEFSGNMLRDTRSAFAALVRVGIDLAQIAATPADVRVVLAGLASRQLNASEKRIANIRSLVVCAVEQFGHRRLWITKEIALRRSGRCC